MNPREIQPRTSETSPGLREKIESILAYGMLAPSTHNSQPWLFKMKESSVEVYADPSVHIKEADPKGRDLYISLGCAIENIVVAAKYAGIFKSLSYRLGEVRNLIAEIHLQESGIGDTTYKNIFETILRRVNARGIFKSDPELNRVLEGALRAAVEYGSGKIIPHLIVEKSGIKRMAELTAEGLKTAYKNKNFRNEMALWVRNSLTRKKDGIPGYSLKMPFLVSFIFPYLVRAFDIGKKLAFLNYMSLSSAPAIVVLSSQGETKEEWLETGRLAERLMLEIQSHGFQTSIFVASVEMGELYKEVQKLLGTAHIPNFVFAAGKLNGSHKSTPRHNLEDKLIR